MKVLIVAKTRRGSRACVGGITFEGQSLRLVAANNGTNERAGMEFEVGEVWDVDARPPASIVPPHVENVIVYARRKLGPMTEPVPFIESHMPARLGGPSLLFDGLAQTTEMGSLYIAERSGVPSYSTMFWRPDRPLTLQNTGKTPRYTYPAPDGPRTLAFVGFQVAIPEIPSGTLVRVSLAHWWRPEEHPEAELRCYVQISGWFLPGQPQDRPGAAGRRPARAPDSGVIALPSVAPGSGDMRGLLKSVFGYDAFLPLQQQIVSNVLARRDTLAIMPTGSGKSLCYQLPALVLPGLTLVVSPLIALMQDQVDQLHQLGVAAAFLNSSLAYPEYVATTGRVRRGEVKLLYTSPETLLAPATLTLLDNCQVSCLAIDEAHCISAWGHDFRPEYRDLIQVRRRYPDAVCVAFTATATPRVQRDIQETLGLDDENQFVASFDRPKLYLQVQPRTDGLAQTLDFLQMHRNESGIIYCSTRKGVEVLVAQLQARGWSVLPYHAGMDDATRRKNQSLFSRDQVPIIVATIAFGMGINKSNVRFVLHHNLPESLESYYQEIGRAGRDGLRADCLLLFSRVDLQMLYRFVEEGAERERAGRHARLQAMVRYAEATGCRRRLLLTYFGEEPAFERCDFCDNCAGEHEDRAEVDVTEAARKFLLCARLTGQIFGPARLIEILRGSRAQDLVRRGQDRLPVYGSGKEYSAIQWKELAEAFIRRGLLDQDMEHGGLRLTAAGRQVLDGESVSVSLLPRSRPRAAAPDRGEIADPELFERLRVLRRELAEAANVPPYVIFSDRTLAEMSLYRPGTPESLLAIHGVGQHKLERYGGKFLDAIRTYCAERNLPEMALTVTAPGATIPAGAPVSHRVNSRSMEVGELYAQGHTVPQIAALYDVKRSTVIQHVCNYARSGGAITPERVRELSSLAAEDQERVLAVMRQLGTEYLRPVYEALAEAVPFDELHILRAYLRAYLRAVERQAVVE